MKDRSGSIPTPAASSGGIDVFSSVASIRMNCHRTLRELSALSSRSPAISRPERVRGKDPNRERGYQGPGAAGSKGAERPSLATRPLSSDALLEREKGENEGGELKEDQVVVLRSSRS